MVNHVPNHVMDVKFVLEGILTPLVGGVGILGKWETHINLGSNLICLFLEWL